MLAVRPHVPGEVERWEMSVVDLQRQLNSQEVLELRARVTNVWEALGHWKKLSPDNGAGMRAAGAFPAIESEAMQWLAWYALHRHPRTYVEFGQRWGFSATMVALASPGVEVYGMDEWVSDRNGEPPAVWFFVHSLVASGDQSYVRQITGDSRTAVARLFAGPGAPTEADLVLLRTDPAYGDAVANGVGMADRLAAGGMILILGSIVPEVERVLDAIVQRYPGFLVLGSRFGFFAVVLAARIELAGN